ncbi:hypothetical protein Tco_1214144 [Tanacetum coccineum]
MDQMRNENKSPRKVPRTLYSVSNAKIMEVEKTEEFPGVEIVEEVNQNGVLHEEKGEEEGAESDNATMSNLNEDQHEDDEKEYEVNMLKKIKVRKVLQVYKVRPMKEGWNRLNTKLNVTKLKWLKLKKV